MCKNLKNKNYKSPKMRQNYKLLKIYLLISIYIYQYITHSCIKTKIQRRPKNKIRVYEYIYII